MLVYLSCLLLVVVIWSYNIDEIDPIPLGGDATYKSEYFGYSVAAQSGPDSSWILVGAPRANVRINNGSMGQQWGAVYNCSTMAGKNTCAKLVLDDTPVGHREEKKGQWTGVVLSRNPDTNVVVTCAHRYTKRGLVPSYTGFTELGVRGRCWTIGNTGAVSEIPQICGKPSNVNDRCNAGLGASYHGSSVDVGGVGYKEGAGILSVYHPTSNNMEHVSATINRMRDRVDKYFGYSVATCKSKDNRYVYTFVGAPRATNLKGQVFIIRKDLRIGKTLSSKFGLGATGSSFGFSVTCGYTKLNTLQIIIGSPTWFDKKVPNDLDRGLVYVFEMYQKYFPNPRNSFFMARLFGQKPGDKFGYTVSVIGDINYDGYEDLAIGAPAEYSPDTGRVYIYMGTKYGITNIAKPVQVIRPMSIPTFPRKNPEVVFGFGSSISGGVDIDNNGFLDVVIGAFHSGKAFLYRSVPIINIEVNNTAPDLIDKNDTCVGEKVACYPLIYCISYHPKNIITSLKNNTFSLSISNTLDIDVNEYSKRVRFGNESSFKKVETVDIKYGEDTEKCFNTTVYLMELLSDIKQLIKIETDIAVVPSATFQQRIALNNSQYSYDITQTKIKTSCGNATCRTDLVLFSSNMSFDMQDQDGPKNNLIYAGYTNLIWSNFTIIRNDSFGKPFGSHFILTMPQSVLLMNFRDVNGTKLPLCLPYGTQDGIYYCQLGEKLDNIRTKEYRFSVELTVTSVKKAGIVTIALKLYSEGSEDQHPANNVVKHTVTVRKLAVVTLSGSSSPSKTRFQVKDDTDNSILRFVEDIGKEQEFTILPFNYGPGTIENLKITMEIPYALNNTLDDDFIYPYDIFSDNEDIQCDQQDLNPKKLKSESGPRRLNEVATGQPNLQSKRISTPTLFDLNILTAREEDDKNSSSYISKYKCGEHVKCVNISCNIPNLDLSLTGIRLTAYIWERSFTKAINITTHIRGWVENRDPDLDLALSSKPGPISVQLSIRAVTEIKKAVNFWIIVGAILGGLCLFGIMILVLYKIGFFVRKRPPSEFYAAKRATQTEKSEAKAVVEVNDGTVADDCESDEDNPFAFHNPMAQFDDDVKI